jgi:hypothetical protein
MSDFAAPTGRHATSTTEQRVGAIATCARWAVSVADLAELLEMLGLDGSAVEIAEGLAPAPAAEPVEQPTVKEIAEAWGTAAQLADDLERALRVLTRLLRALSVAGCPTGLYAEAGRAREYLESLPRAG